VVPFREVFAAIAARGYGGFISYEAPNPAAWSRDPTEVAREALEATRPLLPR
jgi:sugar phosphate isomerase/epimerase